MRRRVPIDKRMNKLILYEGFKHIKSQPAHVWGYEPGSVKTRLFLWRLPVTIEKNIMQRTPSHMSPIFSADAFSRLDESDDLEFYSRDRFVSHIDSIALSTVEKLIGTLVVEEKPAVLDLMAGWDFMYRQGNRGSSYRLMYNPEKDCCMPIPVPTPKALRESIID